MVNKFEWSISSLDIVLGLVGGFSSICWSFLAIILERYQTFKYENSLIGSIFPTSPGGGEHEKDILPSDEHEAKTQMMGTVAGRGKYFYSYTEYNFSKLLNYFCNCCCKKKPWFKRRIQRLERHE